MNGNSADEQLRVHLGSLADLAESLIPAAVASAVGAARAEEREEAQRRVDSLAHQLAQMDDEIRAAKEAAVEAIRDMECHMAKAAHHACEVEPRAFPCCTFTQHHTWLRVAAALSSPPTSRARTGRRSRSDEAPMGARPRVGGGGASPASPLRETTRGSVPSSIVSSKRSWRFLRRSEKVI